MADYINNLAALDIYDPTLTLGPNAAAHSAVITVANNPALLQLAVHDDQGVRWLDDREFLVPPQSFKISKMAGVRFRNANPGQVARILGILSTDADPVFESGLPFTATLSATGALGVSYLGAFTQAQWPPSAPSRTAVAILSDNYGGCWFAWPLEYRDDLNGTYPWRIVNGNTPSSAYIEYVLSVSGNIAWTDAGSFQLPVAGIYQLDIAIGGSTSGASSITAGLGTTSGGHDIATATTGTFAAHTLSTQFTATKGQTIHVTYTASGTTGIGLITARWRPVNLDNA